MTSTLQAQSAALDAPLRLLHPDRRTSPLLVASPHSGRDYPTEFLAASRLDPHTLRRSEDCFVDELLGGATARGIPLLLADFPRAYCDVNREQWELDPAMFADAIPAWCNTRTARVCAGFGTIARLVSSGQPIYAGKLRFADAQDRIRTCWQPYHAALETLIRQTRHAFGLSVLIDCHSMPTEPGAGRTEPDFVLGDAHGSACDPILTGTAQRFLERAGHKVRRNDPYAGGFVTRHYGRPSQGQHALQIEIGRHLYLDQESYGKLPRFDALRDTLDGMLAALDDVARALATT